MSWILENGPFRLTNLLHIGVAVKDAEKTVQALSRISGLADPEIFDYQPKEDELIVGQSFKVRVVSLQFGPVRIELLQPLDDLSIWAKFIDDKGEGIHHVAFGVPNYDEMVDKFKAEGHKMLASASFNGTRWCYLEMTAGGIVIELAEESARKLETRLLRVAHRREGPQSEGVGAPRRDSNPRPSDPKSASRQGEQRESIRAWNGHREDAVFVDSGVSLDPVPERVLMPSKELGKVRCPRRDRPPSCPRRGPDHTPRH